MYPVSNKKPFLEFNSSLQLPLSISSYFKFNCKITKSPKCYSTKNSLNMRSAPKLSYYPQTPVQLTSFPHVSVSPSVFVPPTNAALPDAEADLKPVISNIYSQLQKETSLLSQTHHAVTTFGKAANNQCKQISLIHNKLLRTL